MQASLRIKRSNVDFSKHKLIVENFTTGSIYQIKQSDTSLNSITYISCRGAMSVTGDFGNWIFSREFHPSAGGYVDASYWDEKLIIGSRQQPHIYSPKATIEQIERFKASYKDNYGEEMSDEVREWVELLQTDADDEHEYVFSAYRRRPSAIDSETVPFGTERHAWLNAVYDGFNFMCELMAKELV